MYLPVLVTPYFLRKTVVLRVQAAGTKALRQEVTTGGREWLCFAVRRQTAVFGSESGSRLKGPESCFWALKHGSMHCTSLETSFVHLCESLDCQSSSVLEHFASILCPRQASSVGSHMIMRMPVY